MRTALYLTIAASFLTLGCESRDKKVGEANQTPPPANGSARTDNSTPGASPSAGTMNTPQRGTMPPRAAPAGDSVSGNAMGDDARILTFLHNTDQEEVRVGTLAQTKATSAEAKSFADMLVKDHSDHDTQVIQTAKSANIMLGEPSPGAEDPIATLTPLSGAEFDKKFGELMVKGHRDAIKMLEDAQSKLTNSDVKELVSKTLPTLHHHLDMAQRIIDTASTATAPTP